MITNETDQLELIPASEVTPEMIAKDGQPYRPGTSFGYCHACVDGSLSLGLPASWLYFRLIALDSLGLAVPTSEKEALEMLESENDLDLKSFAKKAWGELVERNVIVPDGDSVFINEQEFWKK